MAIEIFNAERSKQIEDAIIKAASVNGSGFLILTRNNNTTFSAGSVIGPKGDTGVGFTPIDLGSATNLDTVKTPGVYTQGLNANATAANNYPVAAAGVLEVLTTPTANMAWQQYYVYNGGVYANTLWIRSTTSGGAWSAWRCVQAPTFAAIAPCDTALSLTSVGQDVSGCNIVLPVLDTNDTFLVSCNIDVTSIGTTATTAICRLYANGTVQGAQCLWQTAGVNGLRSMISQQWLISGLPAGNRTLQLNAYRSTGADAMIRIAATHTTLSAVRI